MTRDYEILRLGPMGLVLCILGHGTAWTQEAPSSVGFAANISDQAHEFWAIPQGAAAGETCTVTVMLNAEGGVGEVTIRECASIAFANSMIGAIGVAAPFPRPQTSEGRSISVDVTFVVPAEGQSPPERGNILYPADARRAGEEGRVSVRVCVSTIGLIESLDVVDSSGYPRLDRAAQITVSSLKRFPPAPTGGETPRRCWTLPINFSLHTGKPATAEGSKATDEIGQPAAVAPATQAH